jgi:hypothetical protein
MNEIDTEEVPAHIEEGPADIEEESVSEEVEE